MYALAWLANLGFAGGGLVPAPPARDLVCVVPIERVIPARVVLRTLDVEPVTRVLQVEPDTGC